MTSNKDFEESLKSNAPIDVINSFMVKLPKDNKKFRSLIKITVNNFLSDNFKEIQNWQGRTDDTGPVFKKIDLKDTTDKRFDRCSEVFEFIINFHTSNPDSGFCGFGFHNGDDHDPTRYLDEFIRDYTINNEELIEKIKKFMFV